MSFDMSIVGLLFATAFAFAGMALMAFIADSLANVDDLDDLL